jgi:hypothetical protein
MQIWGMDFNCGTSLQPLYDAGGPYHVCVSSFLFDLRNSCPCHDPFDFFFALA